MVRLPVVAALAASLLVAGASAVCSQEARQNEAGQFRLLRTFAFVVAVVLRRVRRAAQRRDPVAAMRRAAIFIRRARAVAAIVKGFPEYCQVPSPRLYHGIVSSMLDLMPAPRLVYNQWDKHGTCSGLAPRDYFDTVRKARAAVKIPPEYIDLKEPLSVAPAAIEEAFIKANPGLTENGFAIECDKKRLTEVRICLSEGSEFRECDEIARPAASGNSY